MEKVTRWSMPGLLVAFWLVCAMTGYAGAASPSELKLDEAIQVVRQNFVIPAELSAFSSSLNQNDGGKAWYLVWNDPNPSGGRFSAQVDAVTGEITAMNSWQPPKGSTSHIPVISWADARDTSRQLLLRLIPKRMESLIMIEDPEPSPISSSGPITYTINWRRAANQVPIDGIAAWVSIDAGTGEVQGYSLNWSALPLPDPREVISPAAAQQSFTGSEILKLEYKTSEQMVPLAEKPAAGPMLVYIVDHPSDGAIDALTGKPLLPSRVALVTGAGAEGMGGMEDQALQAPVPLTPEEQQEIENIAGLIDQEQAAGIIMRWAGGGSQELALRSAQLEKDWRDKELRVWSLNWSAPAVEGKSYQYLHGRVNARTGELLSFNLGLPSAEVAGEGLSLAQARSKADSFLQRIQGPRFSQFRLDPSISESIEASIPVKEWSAWNLRYLRIADGIPFPDNGANITVDRLHDRITAYSLDWDYTSLPPAVGTLGLEAANRLYLQQAPLTLIYAPYYSPEKRDTEMRLVYLPKTPDGQPAFRMLNAFSGERLDYRGQPVSAAATARVFNDIDGNFAEKEITLLGKAGLLTEYGDAFHPAETVKLVDLLRAMVGIYQGPETSGSMSDDEVIKRALAQGWIKESMPPESTVSRGLLAQLMVRSLGLDYLAEIPEIYQLPYRDATRVTEDLKGYAALSWGLGIIRADGVSFEAQHITTRAEAAAAMVHSLGAKR